MKNKPLFTVGLVLVATSCGDNRSFTVSMSGQTDASAFLAEAGISLPDAGASPTGPDVPPVENNFELVDDMDHLDKNLPAPPPGSAFTWSVQRLGNWFVSLPGKRDTDATIASIVPPRGTSKKACRAMGTKMERGLDLWAQLDHPGGRPVRLDAYAGIAFWARLKSPSGQLVVSINDNRPDNFFVAQDKQSPWLTQRLMVSDEWARFVLRFADFSAANNTKAVLDSTAVVSIDFIVGQGGETFDLWIDDLELLCRGRCP